MANETKKPARREHHALQYALRLEFDDMVLTTGRIIRADVVRRCVAAGWLISVGPVPMADGDGCALQPERYREGFALTDIGRAHA